MGSEDDGKAAHGGLGQMEDKMIYCVCSFIKVN